MFINKKITFVGLLLLLSACADSSLTAQCKNVLPPSQSQFTRVYSLFTSSGEKSCSGCHSASRPGNNYDLESKVGVYDALTNHFDIVYGQIASGSMPEDGQSWSSSDLQVLESWYCNGGFYEN